MIPEGLSDPPPLEGVREHVARVKMLVNIAANTSEEDTVFRLQMAAICSCQASIEIMLESAERGYIVLRVDSQPKLNRANLEFEIVPKVPFYDLIQVLRIHDFHRFGISPAQDGAVFIGGPIKMIARGGIAAMALTPLGMEAAKTGTSSISRQRPLARNGNTFFDEISGRWVKLQEITRAFLEKSDDLIRFYIDRLAA